MRVGATYSHTEIKHLGFNQAEAWADVLGLGFAVVRLGAYWSEIEPEKGKFDISVLQAMIEDCQKRGQKVVVTLGMKAPRWPEYYVPKWLAITEPAEAEIDVLAFMERVVGALQGYDCIEAWQVENEPLDGSGPDSWAIPLELLAKEVELVRQLDGRPIHLTAWGNSLSANGYLPQLAALADVVGVDIYYRTPKDTPGWQKRLGWNRPQYAGPADSDQLLKQLLGSLAKPVWISELQAEAWEHRDAGKWQARPGSISGKQLEKNMQRASQLGVEAILMWGVEYWYWQKEHGRPELWQTGKALITQYENEHE